MRPLPKRGGRFHPPEKDRFSHLTILRSCAIISKLNQYRGVEQLVARRAHNPEVVGSNPSPATTKKTVFDKKTVFFFTIRKNKLLLLSSEGRIRGEIECAYIRLFDRNRGITQILDIYRIAISYCLSCPCKHIRPYFCCFCSSFCNLMGIDFGSCCCISMPKFTCGRYKINAVCYHR